MMPPGSHNPMIREPWQKGDLALCVSDGDWTGMFTLEDRSGPAIGSIHRVTEFMVHLGAELLGFAEYPEHLFLAAPFCRIAPLGSFERETFLQEIYILQRSIGRKTP